MPEQAVTTEKRSTNPLWAQVEELRAMSIRELVRLYRPSERIFAFRIRRGPDGDVLEGISRRYTAIVLLALAGESPETAATILRDTSIREVCDRLINDAQRSEDLGAVALTLWAARLHRHPGVRWAWQRLREMAPERMAYPTVEVAWSLSSLLAGGLEPADQGLADAIAERLVKCFCPDAGLFRHWPAGVSPGRLRAHVACFADLVYPVQALSNYHRATGHHKAADIASHCGARMCMLQGPQGQWWWHYDVRTGRMLERFPVYSIHQDAMGPMALFDLQEACGGDYLPAIERSMRWLNRPPETDKPLVDREFDVIWRKVARHEPGKMVRNLQATLSWLHPALRLPGADLVFPPGWIDYESRPYHMGWLLYAWNPARLARLQPD